MMASERSIIMFDDDHQDKHYKFSPLLMEIHGHQILEIHNAYLEVDDCVCLNVLALPNCLLWGMHKYFLVELLKQELLLAAEVCITQGYT
jgi:hypothetical protein